MKQTEIEIRSMLRATVAGMAGLPPQSPRVNALVDLIVGVIAGAQEEMLHNFAVAMAPTLNKLSELAGKPGLGDHCIRYLSEQTLKGYQEEE